MQISHEFLMVNPAAVNGRLIHNLGTSDTTNEQISSIDDLDRIVAFAELHSIASNRMVMSDVWICATPCSNGPGPSGAIEINGTFSSVGMPASNPKARASEMDRMIARHSVRTAFQLNRLLNEYLSFAKAHISSSEFDIAKIRVGEAIDKINVALINTAISEFPELNEEIESSLEKYGKYL